MGKHVSEQSRHLKTKDEPQEFPEIDEIDEENRGTKKAKHGFANCGSISFGGIAPAAFSAVLLAALCHELGHYAVLRSRGGWVRHMEISALGANMQVAGRLSYGSELLAAAGGPAVNLLLAAALAALMVTRLF